MKSEAYERGWKIRRERYGPTGRKPGEKMYLSDDKKIQISVKLSIWKRLSDRRRDPQESIADVIERLLNVWEVK